MSQILDPDKPWDHPYEAENDNICIHCGLIGSYAHTEEYYRKWVWGLDPIGYKENE